MLPGGGLMRKSALCAIAFAGTFAAAQALADVAPAPRKAPPPPPPAVVPPPPPPIVAPPPGPLFIYGPNHYIAAAALYMRRDKGDLVDTFHGDRFLGGRGESIRFGDATRDAFDEWQPGAEVRVGIRIGDPWWLTADVFWIHG